MSRGSVCMQSVARDTWRFGYLYVDSSNTTGRQDLNVNRCEFHFCFGETAKATLFLHVSGINRSFRRYDLALFEDEDASKRMVSAENDYIDGFGNSIEICSVGNPLPGQMTEDIIRILHSLIYEHLIRSDPPMQDGNPAAIWYVGFVKRQITEVEYASKRMLRPIVLSLGQIKPR